jgi:formylglycine-generating enzyme required for sulfatase activity
MAEVGKQLGDYTLVEQVSKGPLGANFLSQHRFMRRSFLLKVLPLELCENQGFIKRLEEGVGNLVSLEHKHLVKIHNISCVDGRYFLVTDAILDGEQKVTSLDRYLEKLQKRPPEEEIYVLLTQIASALDDAHEYEECDQLSGLDVSHILIGEKEGKKSFYLSDFGLNSILGQELLLSRTYQILAESFGPACEDVKKQLALQDAFVDIYRYMAPEQKKHGEKKLKQDRKKMDAYAFGVLAFYLLMGKYPEGYPTLPNVSDASLVFEWDEFIASCLSDNPENRPRKLLPELKVLRKREIESGKTPHPLAEAVQEKMKMELKKEALVAAVVASLPEELRPVLRLAELERPKVDHDPAAALRVDPLVKSYVQESKEFDNVEPMQTEMIVINGGSFSRGSQDGNRDEMPTHFVDMKSFAIDVHPVSNEQFVLFLEAMGGEKDSNHQDIIRLRDSRIKRTAGKLMVESGYLRHPVVGVTWYGAVAYAKWLGKRLPTEAEWEIAAKGGEECPLYPTGISIERNQANFFSSDTTAVKSYAPNSYGIYDMAGNVYEWCLDWYDYNYYETSIQEPKDPQGPPQGVYRVLRGGCWKSLKEDLRCSRRHRNNPGTVNGTYGFRCAADVS